MICIGFCETWARYPSFDTIQAVAKTFSAAFQIFHFRHWIVAPLAADSTRAVYQLAIDHNATPYAGP